MHPNPRVGFEQGHTASFVVSEREITGTTWNGSQSNFLWLPLSLALIFFGLSPMQLKIGEMKIGKSPACLLHNLHSRWTANFQPSVFVKSLFACVHTRVCLRCIYSLVSTSGKGEEGKVLYFQFDLRALQLQSPS